MAKSGLNGGNGHSRISRPWDNKKLKFPVKYHLKAVLEASQGEETDKQNLETVFKSQGVSYSFEGHRPSSRGNYISYTYQVTLQSKAQLEKLYEELKKVKGLKFAL